MALAPPVHKGSANSAAATVATASWTPANNRLYLCAVVNRLASGAGAGNTPTVSGNGMTWVQIGAPITVVAGGPTYKITFFRAMVASGATAGVTTADFAGQTQTRAVISVDEYDGAQVGGTNGDTAVPQNNSNTGTGTTGSVSLAAFAAAANGAHACFVHATAEVSTQESGWTELLDDSGSGTGTEVEGRNSNDTTPTANWASSVIWAGFAVEIAANITQLIAASIVHTRVTPGGVKVSPSVIPTSITHARALNTTTISSGLKTVSLVHTRALSPAPTISPTLKPLSLVHTRVTQAPRIALNVTLSTSIVHARAINTGTRLNSTLKPLSIVHSRTLGFPPNVYQGPPPIIPYFRSFGRFPDWWFDPVRLHK